MAHLESLVVLDPQRSSREALTFGFERAGYSVYSTEQGADALAMAQTRVVQLLVVSSQQSDALGVVGRLREDDPTRELPIVVLGERDARESALRAGADEFVARPAFIRDVVTLAKLAVAVRQDGDAAGVVGMLEDYGLYFLTRALAVAGRSGVLEVERGRRRGEVHFVQGQVVGSRAGKMTGVPAFQQLLLWTEASMQLRFETPTGERKIQLHVDELLAQGAAFVQEFERLARRIGGPQAVYHQAPTRAANHGAKIPPEVLGLVKLFDGKRPLVDVAEDSPFKAFDTIKITYRLADLGAIERVDGNQVESPLTAQLAVRDWLLGSGAPSGDRSTVTEAGRRAAEAYAAEEARRAAEPAPAADLFGDTDRTPKLAPDVGAATLVDVPSIAPVAPAPVAAAPAPQPVAPQAAAPQLPLEEMPTAPREAQRGPEARNKKRDKHKQRGRDTDRTPKVDAAQPAPSSARPPEDATVPMPRVPPPPPDEPVKPAAKPEAAKAEAAKAAVKPELKPAAKPEPAKSAAKPEPAKSAAKPEPAKSAAKPEPAKSEPVKPAAKPSAAKHEPHAREPHKNEPHKPHDYKPAHEGAAAKLSAQAAAGAHTKEPVFDDVDEDFFAQGAELHKEAPVVDTFDDLDASQAHRKVSPRRSWFSFGAKKPPPPTAKKR